MADIGETPIDYDKIKTYAADASRVGGAIESLKKSDGWQIFRGLLERHKKEILLKSDYADDLTGLAQFKGDRKAIDIIEDIFTEMDSFVEDAARAQESLLGISGTEEEKPRGIMLIEALEEGANREA